MKKDKLVQDLAERLSIPEQALGESMVTVTAGRRLLVENHRGILEYGTELIAVALGRGRLLVFGSELCLEAMNQRELLLGGSIRRVEWED